MYHQNELGMLLKGEGSSKTPFTVGLMKVYDGGDVSSVYFHSPEGHIELLMDFVVPSYFKTHPFRRSKSYFQKKLLQMPIQGIILSMKLSFLSERAPVFESLS